MRLDSCFIPVNKGGYKMKEMTILVTIITVILVIPLVPMNVKGETPEGVPQDILDFTPHWKEFSRDQNHNGVDDIIDKRTDDNIPIIVDYDHHPTDQDVKNLKSLGLTVWYRAKYIDALLVSHVTREQINVIRFIKGVNMVEINPEMKPLLDHSVKGIKVRPTDAGTDGVKYHDVWDELGFNGTGVNIAILDTGVDDVDHESLDDMDDNPLTIDPKFIAGYYYPVGGRFVNPHDFGIGHGTHCAGIALGTGGANHKYEGVAPGARLVDVKTLSDAGVGGMILPAMDWCISNNNTDWENDGPANNGIQVMSMSLGGPDSNGDDSISQEADAASAAGIVVVAAMGNDGTRRVSTPAAADTAISIAASDDHNTVKRDDDTFAGYSNYGPRGDGYLKPDVTAPGTQIMSALRDTWNGYVNMDGTSMATPHVSGLVALMLQANPDLTPAQVKQILHKTAESRGNHHIDPSEPKYDTHWGWGLINGYAAVKMALGAPDLTVDSLNTTSSNITEGDSMELRAEVRELNGKDVSADIKFYDETDSTLISTVHASFNGGQSKSIDSGTFTAKGGNRTFSVKIVNADPEEESTSNNEKTFSTHINYRPVPDIKANLTHVKTGEKITFNGTDSSDRDGSVKGYYFDFADGNSTGWQGDSSAEHAFADDGNYTVTLKVRDNNGAESSGTDSVTVQVDNRPPTAHAGPDRTANAGDPVDFNGTGDDPDGYIALYEWDFESDGVYDWNSTESGDTTHTYDTPGNYTATLRVTDDDGAQDTDSRVIHVLPGGSTNNPPDAVISSPTDGATYQLGDSISFDGSQSSDPDGDSLSYIWTDNGEEIGNTATFSKSLSGGHHTIVLQVDDGRGGTDTDTVRIFVNSPPTAAIKSPRDGEDFTTDDDISFDASDSSDPDGDHLSYTWHDNGAFLSGYEKFSKRLSAGEHNISLEADDGNGGTDSTHIFINVTEPENHRPVAKISSPEEGGTYRDVKDIEFDGSQSSDADGDTLNYRWYDNGHLLSDKAKFSARLDAGDHTIKLYVWDPQDAEDTAYVNITVTKNHAPVARITSPEDGEVYMQGESIDFDGSESSDEDGDAMTFTWWDGNTTISSSAVFSKVLTPGDHTIKLEVSDGNANSSTDVFIRVDRKPVAVISSPEDGAVVFSDESVTFDGSKSYDSDGNIVSYAWYDNDENIGSGKTLEYVPDTGGHEIRLTVKDNDGATASSTINVKSVDHSIALSFENQTVTVQKGEDAVFNLKVRNLAEVQDTVSLSADTDVKFSESSFSIDANAEKTITMTVKANEDKDISITAWAGQSYFRTTASVKIAQEYGVSLKSSTTSKTGAPGETLSFLLVLTNTGNGDDTMSISFEANQPWQISVEPTSVSLHAGTSKQVIVRVKLPSAGSGEGAQITVTATSMDGVTKDSIDLTATVVAQEQPPVKPSGGGSSSTPGFEAAVLIGAVILSVGVFSLRRRRS